MRLETRSRERERERERERAADARERRRRLTRFHAATHTRRHVVPSWKEKERKRKGEKEIKRREGETWHARRGSENETSEGVEKGAAKKKGKKKKEATDRRKRKRRIAHVIGKLQNARTRSRNSRLARVVGREPRRNDDGSAELCSDYERSYSVRTTIDRRGIDSIGEKLQSGDQARLTPRI